MKIKIINNTDYDLKKEIDLAKVLFNNLKGKDAFSVVFISKDEIHKLNYVYRNINRPTDVLSFSTDNEIKGDLGDVLISPEIAFSNAISYGNSNSREILFLIVHGYLHLLGYDHQSLEEEKVMMNKTEELLSIIDLNIKE